VMMFMSTNRKDKNAWGIPSMETYLTSIMIRKKRQISKKDLFYLHGIYEYTDNRHHSSWPFLECRSSKLYFKILWKYDDWSFRFHPFLENGRFYWENTYKCSPLVTKFCISTDPDNLLFLSGLI
jgi:hypothetical protein